MDKDRIGELLSKARAEYGPPWPPALTRYLEGGEEGPVPEEVLEERLAVLRSGAMNIAVHPRDSRKSA